MKKTQEKHECYFASWKNNFIFLAILFFIFSVLEFDGCAN
jgi:hypothetical protein